jgi:hypothetical protein
MKWPVRYFSGLSPSMVRVRRKELRTRTAFKLGRSDQGARVRKSRWTQLFHKVYPDLKFKKNLISKKTGIPARTLDTVYNRGRRAWQTSGSRPGVTADQWGTARVYKYVLVTLHKAPRAWYARRPDPNNNLRRK